MVISEKKLLANRMNLLKAHGKSTGPRSTSRTRFNAVKHGMTASQPTMLPCEDEEEFRNLHQGIMGTFFPQNAAEERTVEQITLCLWKLRRGMVAEQAVLKKYPNPDSAILWALSKTNHLGKIARYERRLMNYLLKRIDSLTNRSLSDCTICGE